MNRKKTFESRVVSDGGKNDCDVVIFPHLPVRHEVIKIETKLIIIRILVAIILTPKKK